MLQAIEYGWLAVKWKFLEFYYVGMVLIRQKIREIKQGE